MSWLLYIICCALLSIVVLYSGEHAYTHAKEKWSANRSLEKRDDSYAHKMTAQVMAETDTNREHSEPNQLDDYANSLLKQL